MVVIFVSMPVENSRKGYFRRRQSRVDYGYRKIRVLLNGEAWNAGEYLAYLLSKERAGH
jgi:hypothetical protein